MYTMAKAFKSSEGMTKASPDKVTSSGKYVDMSANRNWIAVIQRFDKDLVDMNNVPKKILELWKNNIKRY